MPHGHRTFSHQGASTASLLANASATIERDTRGKTLIISTRRRSACLQASANIGDQRFTSPDCESRSMSHNKGISPRSPLHVLKPTGNHNEADGVHRNTTLPTSKNLNEGGQERGVNGGTISRIAASGTCRTMTTQSQGERQFPALTEGMLHNERYNNRLASVSAGTQNSPVIKQVRWCCKYLVQVATNRINKKDVFTVDRYKERKSQQHNQVLACGPSAERAQFPPPDSKPAPPICAATSLPPAQPYNLRSCTSIALYCIIVLS